MKNSHEKFLEDLKTSKIIIYVPIENVRIKLSKKEVLKIAETKEIKYYITEDLYTSKRKTMVIY